MAIQKIRLFTDDFCFLSNLSNSEAGVLFKYILKYVFEGHKNPHPNQLIRVAFSIIKPSLDRELSRSGENHWNWKGGITPENNQIRNGEKIKEWRKEVFSRDNYTCQRCNKESGVLNAHHIKPFSTHKELRFEVSNGITLCKSCHIKLHSKKHG